MSEWKQHQLGDTLWLVANSQVNFNDEGKTMPAVLFTKGKGSPQYGFLPVFDVENTGQVVTKAAFILLTEDGKGYEQTLPADIFPKEVRDFVSDRIQSQIAAVGMHFSDGLIERIEKGEKQLIDDAYVPTAEIDQAIEHILAGSAGQSDAAKQASQVESKIAGDRPADYHEQIDRLLDEGGPEAAKAYADQFRPKGSHAAQQDARREQGGEERSR